MQFYYTHFFIVVENLKMIWPVLKEISAQLYVHTYKCYKV